MPGWTASNLLKNRQVDAFINVRSMMEMSSNVIKEYFGVIHANNRENGLFACIDRYIKLVKTRQILARSAELHIIVLTRILVASLFLPVTDSAKYTPNSCKKRKGET